ncbi:MAG: ABC transporter substrate-binding protein [Bacteroidota bacterium]
MRKIVLLLLTSAFFLACSSKKDQENNTKTVFRYNESAGITSLDPAFARSVENIWAVNQLFNGLVQLNDKLEVEPCVANAWEISEDALVYTFHLRNDVYFHDSKQFKEGKGRKVIANDFVYSFSRIIDENVASPGAWIFNNIDKSAKSGYLGFVAKDDTTLQVYLKKPFPPFLSLLSMQYCSVVPMEVVEYYGNDFRNNPCGSGPFKFKLWKEGEKLIFVKNDNYFEYDGNARLPYLDAVAISFIKDKQSAFLEFVKGNFDFMSGIESAYKDEVLSKDGTLNKRFANKFTMYSQPYLKTDYLGIMMDEKLQKSPLKSKAVRQAINYGFDRKKMIAYLRNNIGTPANSGFIPLGMPGFDSTKVKGYYYSPDKAKKLLAEAGYPEGKGLGEITLVSTSMYLDLCEFMQSQLSEIGIKLKIEILSPAVHSEMVARGDASFFRKNWTADYPDAENYLALFYSKNLAPAGPNYTHFKSAAFDGLYELAASEVNDAARYNYYQEMDKLIIQEAPVVPLYYDATAIFYHKNVKDLTSNPLNLLNLKKVIKINIDK